jgi:hypothetical protein
MKKKIKNPFEKFVIFSNIFLPILHNIGLYIYIVKYKSDFKIPDFLQNISKKKCFHASGQILKTFPSIFSLKKKLASLSCFENKNGYHNRFMIIH